MNRRTFLTLTSLSLGMLYAKEEESKPWKLGDYGFFELEIESEEGL